MFRIEVHDEVTSTNLEVKRALRAGESEGLVVRAYRQSGGYGRQGRSWASPLGGLYCSWLLRPFVSPGQLPTLSLVVALAFRHALASLADEGLLKTLDLFDAEYPGGTFLGSYSES